MNCNITIKTCGINYTSLHFREMKANVYSDYKEKKNPCIHSFLPKEALFILVDNLYFICVLKFPNCRSVRMLMY